MSGYSFDTTAGTDPDGYDDDDRLTYFKRSSNANPQTWNLSAVGDWDSWSDFGTNETRTHGAAHEFTSFIGATSGTLSYDVKGNLTENKNGDDYIWDIDNRMQSVDTDNDSTADVTFEYDATGRRVARNDANSNIVYIHSGQRVIADQVRGTAQATPPIYKYVWAAYIDEPILREATSGTKLYYHHNQQFSTVALTNASGQVIERYAYTAYGEQTILDNTGATQTWATNQNRYTYTGREWDVAISLYHFRARYYDAQQGRFISRDPLGFVDGMSLYRGYFRLAGRDPGEYCIDEYYRDFDSLLKNAQANKIEPCFRNCFEVSG